MTGGQMAPTTLIGQVTSHNPIPDVTLNSTATL